MTRLLVPRAKARLAKFTTWRVGGLAEWLAEPKSLEETIAWVEWSKEKGLRCQVIGAGSNLLIHDDGLSGLCLCLRRLQCLIIDTNSGMIEALAGEPISSLSRRAAHAGLHGLEWAIGIPGTVGGATVMNAGAQGGCIADRLVSVRVIPIHGGDSFELHHNELSFAYRHSRLQQENLVVLSARFKLEPGYDPEQIGRKTHCNLNHRTNTQPYQQPSCGSVFRNPEPQKAGQLIETLGLKGTRIGGAEISTVHANFIVNVGDAQANDINKLIYLVQERVESQHNLYLHPEVKRLGFAAAV
ncbi:UDP-N-acetylmuramate dehydrogenase [Synechococcus sp. M16CYN]|uniref:UDP-N-acetylmuramate dehydrogenase n=1 Tax=Synechococcus sp. M16CYN TaxID=3103139 RepID=UPI003248D143